MYTACTKWSDFEFFRFFRILVFFCNLLILLMTKLPRKSGVAEWTDLRTAPSQFDFQLYLVAPG
jgi:hypothetical protein